MCADCTEGIVKSYCQKITNLKKQTADEVYTEG